MHAQEQEGYDQEELLPMHTMLEEEEQERAGRSVTW